MADSVSFDEGCEVIATSQSIKVMVEMYCLGSGTTVKDFPLGQTVHVDSVQGTLSFYGLNWNWWKKFKNGNTAICGIIGTENDAILAFDIQGRGADPITVPVYAIYPSSIPIKTLRFNIYPDLNLPTDFRVALAFNRS